MQDNDPRYLEQAVLGGMIIDSKIAPLVRAKLLGSHPFYFMEHKIIYQAIIDIYEDVGSVDLVMLKELLERTGKLNDAGGIKYLVKVAESTPSSANWEYYCGLIQDKHLRRQLVQFAAEIQTMSADREPASVILSKIEAKISSLVREEIPETGLVSLNRMSEAIAAFDNKTIYIPTGFRGIDEKIYGLANGDFIVIAGRPGMGKTVFATDIALNLAEREIPVIFFSVEMPWIQLHQRIICGMSGVHLAKAMKGYLSAYDKSEMKEAAEKLRPMPLHIDDNRLTPTILRSKIMQYKSKHGIRVVFIDYLQLMTPDKHVNKYEDITAIADAIKLVAREEQVPVVLVSQLNRSVEDRPNKKPRLSDLKGSGSTEEHADVVIMLYRPDYYEGTNTGEAWAIGRKNRRGAAFEVPLCFDAERTKFMEYADDSGEDETLFQE